MINIINKAITLNADTQVKQKAAVKQMQDLIADVSTWVKHKVLTNKDRANLEAKGYARDLVNNLVYLTERPSSQSSEDSHVTGFTIEAFDPSIYASDEIYQHFTNINHHKCCWCERKVASDGIISHFRPSYGRRENGQLQRLAYYKQAYNLDNLMFSCRECSEHYKSDRFPTIEKHQAKAHGIDDELPLLVNPYFEQPRDFVRFNPVTAEAYPFDLICQFYKDKFALNQVDIVTKLQSDIGNIPSINGCSDLDKEYQQWLKSSISAQVLSKGSTTIDVLGLNRPSLVRQRLEVCKQYRAIWLASNSEPSTPETNKIKQHLENIANAEAPELTFSALLIDALCYWQLDNNQDWDSDHQPTVKEEIAPLAISPLLRSSLIYIVLDNELSLKNKRRIIQLNNQDLLYSSTTGKCVFLPIDWNNDFSNVIKVHENNHTWETSFSELNASRATALSSLFANAEVWAEGNYCSIS
ncbi:hypothetical protein [Paraferrimonas sp. SM1919]|uniref:hypothetical protein n=1 Tax=Paraferrimonas sp. SM1919 TaxID=2662263 RepID=UPI0013D6BFEE|nr:hypothetical protein [Paraferrimonas sp. SM1919]